MKPNNAGEDMWLRARTANKNLNQDTQTTEGADVMHAVSHAICSILKRKPFEASRRLHPVKFSQ